MAIIKALLSSFGSSSERIIHPFLTSSSITFSSYLLPFFFPTDLAQLHSLIALQQFMRGLGEEMNETELVGKNIHDWFIKGSGRGDLPPFL